MSDFHLILIKPSHYDDEGYVIQWGRSAMPSNTLATLSGIADDCVQRQVLGPDVQFHITTIDETNTRVRVKKLIRQVRLRGGCALVCMVGVQSNQFPRALDLARRFRAQGLLVCIGGFHVSGCLAMLKELTPELREARRLGISLFAGEAEGHFDEVLRDAHRCALRPVYNYLGETPSLESAPAPLLAIERVRKTAGAQASFDAGRGCPFECSFCTIINVQGRKSRYRSADDIEKLVRANLAQGIKRFFITDDNFARNKNWEAIFDRLIEMQEAGADFRLVIQVDTLCHKISGFISKSKRAGVRRVFIGLESVNPANLASAKKSQNRIDEYRSMLLEWRAAGIITTAGYILGFPDDTPESIARDIELIKRELPIDLLEFFYLTPLPGSEDHAKLHARGAAMESDLNQYDLNHITTAHPRMSREEWTASLRAAWDSYYSPAHIETLMKRAQASELSLGKILGTIVAFYGSVIIEGVHPLESGFLRLKQRTERRPGFAVEHPLLFYPKYLANFCSKTIRAAALYARFLPLRRRLERDARDFHYTDRALETGADDSDSELRAHLLMPVAPEGGARVEAASDGLPANRRD